MKLSKGLALLLVLALALVVSAGCGGKEEPKADGDAADTPAKEVVIGYTGPLSGVAAEYGQDCLNGLDMAVREINEAGGFMVGDQKYLIRLEKLDDEANPTNAVSNAHRLRDQYNVPAIFNPVFTTIAPMMEINQENGNEFLVMAYTSTPMVVKMDNKMMVAVPPPFTVYAKGMVDHYIKGEGAKTAAMLVTLGAYGDEWREAFKEKWEKAGGKVVADKPANYYAETDFSAQITACLAENPDVMLIGGPSAPTALVVEQARSLGFKGSFLLVDQAKMGYVANILKGYSLLEGSMGVSDVAAYPYQATPAFVEKAKELYNKEVITSEVPLHYIAMYALTRAMSAAGTVEDPVAIRAAFPKAFPMSGDEFPVHYFSVSDVGRMEVIASMQTVENGEMGEIKSYIWHLKTEDEYSNIQSTLNLAQPTTYYFQPKTEEQ